MYVIFVSRLLMENFDNYIIIIGVMTWYYDDDILFYSFSIAVMCVPMTWPILDHFTFSNDDDVAVDDII